MSDTDTAEEHDRGLSHDLPRLISRRNALGLLGLGVAGMGVAACSGGPSRPDSAAPPAPDAGGTTTTATGEIPEETSGPYPADGSNGVDVLSQTGIVRQDITGSFGEASGVAEGVPLTIDLKVIDLQGTAGDAMKDAAVYLWHCDSVGRYSMYSSGVEGENYLRGIQVADDEGRVRFTSIYPGCYSGRWPHVHFEIYPTVQDAQRASNRLRTSQLALPKATSDQVYELASYGNSAQNLAATSLQTDLVFADGYSLQMAKVTGDLQAGLVATLNVPV